MTMTVQASVFEKAGEESFQDFEVETSVVGQSETISINDTEKSDTTEAE